MSSDSKHIPSGTKCSYAVREHQPHWWFESRSSSSNSGSFGSSSAGSSLSSSSTSHFSSSLHDPKVPIPLPSAQDWNNWRRDSLKNM